MIAMFLAAALVAHPAATAAPVHEQRCGWLQNPTPANWWLDDKDGEWILGVQGGYQAGGADLPDMTTRGWVVTNGVDYGYGCACLTATFDHRNKQVATVISARARPLKQCRADRSLPKP